MKCICDCGNIVILDKKSVQNNHTKSCGCLSSETTSKLNQVNHTGKISDYGVKIIRPAEINEKRQWLWYCQCGFCGREFKEIPARVLGNHVKSCGCLKKSSREVYIEKILNDLAIDYKTQYTFNDCRSDNGHTLRFDFAIMKGDRIFCLIEYDGQQHYMPISIWGGEESYEQNIIRDSIKNVYCAEHNLKLLGLPYYLTEQEIKQKIINTIYP